MLQLTLHADPAEFQRVVLGAVRDLLTQVLARVEPRLRVELPAEIERRILASPEYIALKAGRFRGEMGVVNVDPVVHGIIQILSSELLITTPQISTAGGSLEGGMRVGVLAADLQRVLSVPGGSFTSEHGHDVPWLRWLLTAGPTVVVADYHFLGGKRSQSRTGEGIMVHGGSWSVPAQFAGDDGSNWLLRALTGLEYFVEGLVTAELEKGP